MYNKRGFRSKGVSKYMREDLEVLSRDFYNQPTLILAEKLLGHILVHETEEGTTSGRIVETEAYLGESDQAAHSYKKRRTKRTEIMFQAPGYGYINQMQTNQLMNVVAGEVGNPQAILIRAVEPLEGIELMEQRRPVKKFTNLTSGPGKLTKALGITKADYGRTFFEAPLYIAKGHPPSNVVTGTRIGIDNAGEAKDYPYRFWVEGNKFVSR